MKDRQIQGIETNNRQPPDAGLPPESLIRNRTAAEALQQPTTLIPLAVGIASGVYLVLLSPMLGMAGGALALTAISGVAAAVSFAGHYRLAYPRNAGEVIASLHDERMRLNRAELARWREALNTGFLNLKYGEGVTVLSGLSVSYEGLQPALERHRITDPLATSLLPALAEETYRRGLGVLADALELMYSIPIVDGAPLDRNSAPTETGPDDTENQVLREETVRLRNEQLNSFRERREMLLRLRFHAERLLQEAQRCQAALNTTQIEMASARAGGSRIGVDSAISALQSTIRQVKEVQDEFERIGRQEGSKGEIEGGFDDI